MNSKAVLTHSLAWTRHEPWRDSRKGHPVVRSVIASELYFSEQPSRTALLRPRDQTGLSIGTADRGGGVLPRGSGQDLRNAAGHGEGRRAHHRPPYLLRRLPGADHVAEDRCGDRQTLILLASRMQPALKAAAIQLHWLATTEARCRSPDSSDSPKCCGPNGRTDCNVRWSCRNQLLDGCRTVRSAPVGTRGSASPVGPAAPTCCQCQPVPQLLGPPGLKRLSGTTPCAHHPNITASRRCATKTTWSAWRAHPSTGT